MSLCHSEEPLIPMLIVAPVLYFKLKSAAFLPSCTGVPLKSVGTNFPTVARNALLFVFVGAVLWRVKRTKELKTYEKTLKKIRILENYNGHHARHAEGN